MEIEQKYLRSPSRSECIYRTLPVSHQCIPSFERASLPLVHNDWNTWKCFWKERKNQHCRNLFSKWMKDTMFFFLSFPFLYLGTLKCILKLWKDERCSSLLIYFSVLVTLILEISHTKTCQSWSWSEHGLRILTPHAFMSRHIHLMTNNHEYEQVS